VFVSHSHTYPDPNSRAATCEKPSRKLEKLPNCLSNGLSYLPLWFSWAILAHCAPVEDMVDIASTVVSERESAT